jgi:hypothetical protein
MLPIILSNFLWIKGLGKHITLILLSNYFLLTFFIISFLMDNIRKFSSKMFFILIKLEILIKIIK